MAATLAPYFGVTPVMEAGTVTGTFRVRLPNGPDTGNQPTAERAANNWNGRVVRPDGLKAETQWVSGVLL